MTTPLWLSWSLRPFSYSFSVYSCHLFLIFSAYVRFLSSLSFTVPILTWNVPLISPIFLKTSRVFPILLFSSVSLYCSFAKLSYIFFLLSGTLHSVRYIFPFLPCFLLPFFSSAICKASSDNHFAFLHFFFFGMVLFATSYTIIIVWASVHILQAFCSLDQIPWIYSSLPLYIYKAFDLNHTWQA